MKSRFTSVIAIACVAAGVSSCAYQAPVAQAYCQRVEDNSAMYMTGPKAQQTLEENIASCAREIDELVQMDALRGKTPPDTHADYHRALKSSGDLDFYDTPTRYGDKKIAHKDFQDFESCMRYKGWERVRYVRYQTALKARSDYDQAQEIRKWGAVPGTGKDAVAMKQKEDAEKVQKDQFADLNK